mmetsp:Transcript_19874/g.28941  ORF Transcript_19874/g.28941 Transcript_19874/m.28941 type:complete len:145 (-) Transcript_19874:686-1120(-)
MRGYRSLSTPMSIELNHSEKSLEMTCAPFQQLTGSPLHLSTQARPDICFAVGQIARKMASFRLGNFEKARQILMYLAETSRKLLRLRGFWRSDRDTKDFSVRAEREKIRYRLTGYSDASWADEEKTRKSTPGLLVMIDESPVVH